MNNQQSINYQRIEKAIDYLRQNFRGQPDLDTVAADMGLSPFHFQRMFSDWAGISPKKFLQYLSVEYAKGILKTEQATLFDAADNMGLSGTSRLHDLFVNIEAMTPGEYKSGGQKLRINYSYAETLFGQVLTASTNRGLCRMAFTESEEKAFTELEKEFPNAEFEREQDAIQRSALSIFNRDWNDLKEVKLHLKGTDFQLKVWQSLLQIPQGGLSSYGKIASDIGSPNASRAVGTAIGDNPVAYLIPCHRVVQSNGNYGEYRWGSARKRMLIGWEAAQQHAEE